MRQGQRSWIYASFIPASYTLASGSRIIYITSWIQVSWIHASCMHISSETEKCGFEHLVTLYAPCFPVLVLSVNITWLKYYQLGSMWIKYIVKCLCMWYVWTNQFPNKLDGGRSFYSKRKQLPLLTSTSDLHIWRQQTRVLVACEKKIGKNLFSKTPSIWKHLDKFPGFFQFSVSPQ